MPEQYLKTFTERVAYAQSLDGWVAASESVVAMSLATWVLLAGVALFWLICSIHYLCKQSYYKRMSWHNEAFEWCIQQQSRNYSWFSGCIFLLLSLMLFLLSNQNTDMEDIVFQMMCQGFPVEPR
jgi:hypothetical protein